MFKFSLSMGNNLPQFFEKHTSGDTSSHPVRRICIVQDGLSSLDEGTRCFAFNISKTLSENYKTLCFNFVYNSLSLIARIEANKRFLSWKVRRKIKRFNSQFILYIPHSSITFFSLLRAKLLKIFIGKKVLVAIVALQERELPFWWRIIFSLLQPDIVFVQTKGFSKLLSKIFPASKVRIIPSGVDLSKFKPVTPEVKSVLREKYGIKKNAYVILHVGHLNRNRNIEVFKAIGIDNCEKIIVCSTSTLQDRLLLKDLINSKIRIFNQFLSNIEEIYQISDCYLFPVNSHKRSIGIPLSVLEAMACNLCIVSVEFGGLPLFFQERKGFFYYQDIKEMLFKLKLARNYANLKTRETVKDYSWEKIAERMLKNIQEDLEC